MTSEFRQRKAFTFSDDSNNTGDENLILDEQEQDEIIHDLRQAAKRSNDSLNKIISGTLLIGAILQLYFLSMTLRGSELTPFSPILDTFLEPRPLIPLASLLTILHIGILALDITSLLPILANIQKSVPTDVLRYAPLVTCIAPTMALLSGRDVAQLAWWCLPMEMSALVWVSRGWMAGAVEDVAGLERLRYDAKGA